MSQLDLKIGPKIKSFRRQLGLQANKLAEDLGISPSYLNLIESGKRKIDGDLLLLVCEKLNINLSDLTSKTDINLQNTISEILDDTLFEDLDILGPEVKDLVSTNPKIGKAIVRLGDILKKKDHELIDKIEKISGKIVDNRKNSFPGEVISDFLQVNKNNNPIKFISYSNKIKPEIQKIYQDIGVGENVKMKSSLKFCVVAAGEYDGYVAEPRAYEWDIAAGHAILI
ncbi:helix-turn-helix domain-containing protein, partial [Candidatus Pelagibacter bacterium]|nr:helix-turn-helix domain-containing protein [Candidatus Pelagibacter bacterium]